MEINKPAVVVLSIIFISQLTLFILKLTNTINWGWLWILSPLWIPYAIINLIGISIIIYLLTYNIKERIFKKHE